ncbi:MAG: hypothetical protein Q9M92_16675 [Enterobacterales bacterium]|nr:hypothetical protein [Enterobacterales bacterium]
MKKICNKSLILVFALFSFASQAANHNIFNSTLVYGVDTNPNELSAGLNPSIETYYAAELSLKAALFDMLYIDAKANKSLYPNDRRADQYSIVANIGLKSDFLISKEQFEWQLSTDYQSVDQTFVSKASGFVAEVGGISIADRYDFTQFNYQLGIDYLPYRTLKVGFDYKNRNKNYFDLAVTGLPNLNYKQTDLLIGLEYLSSDQGYMFLKAGSLTRRFENRLTRDILGNPILGTNLEYDYYSVDVGYIYQPEDGIEWEYTYNYAHRFDNGSGYYEATSGYMSMKGIYKFTERQFLTGELIYSKLSYENRVGVGSTNDLPEEAEEAAGGRIKVSYEWVMSQFFNTNFAFYMDFQHSLSVNRNSIYTYNRSMASAGFRWSAF